MIRYAGIVDKNMTKTLCYLMGLVLVASLVPRFGSSQSKTDATPNYAPNWGFGWSVEADRFSEHVGPYDGENCIQVYSKYLGHSSVYAVSGPSAKQAIIIDLKSPVSLFDVVGLNIDQKSNGHLIRIHCTKHLPDFESWLKPIGDDTWLYITLADARADVAVLQNFKTTGFIKKVLIFQSATSAQITFLLKGQVTSVELIPVKGSRDILVAVFTPTKERPVRITLN